jgi:hypothetical protein
MGEGPPFSFVVAVAFAFRSHPERSEGSLFVFAVTGTPACPGSSSGNRTQNITQQLHSAYPPSDTLATSNPFRTTHHATQQP